jgi:hypothetical protein
VVGLSGKKSFGFQFGDVRISGVDLFVQIFQEIVFLVDVGFLLGEIDVGLDVAGGRREFLVSGNLFFGALAIAEDTLSRFLIAPEIGIGGASLEDFQALAVLGGVKDSSARE